MPDKVPMNVVRGNVDPMTYPLLFPTGQFGFDVNNQ